MGLFAGQPAQSLGMLRSGTFAAADPVRNLEEGTGLGQEAHGYFFLLEAEDSLLATQQIPLPVRQIKKLCENNDVMLVCVKSLGHSRHIWSN